MGVKARLASVPVPISKSDWSNPSTYHRVKHHLEIPDQYHKRVQCRASLSQTLNLYDGSPVMSRHYQNGRKDCVELGRQVAMKFLCGCSVVEACSDANQPNEGRTSVNHLLPLTQITGLPRIFYLTGRSPKPRA